MIMMMIVMMLAMTPRIEARMSPFCLTHIVHARRLRTKPRASSGRQSEDRRSCDF